MLPLALPVSLRLRLPPSVLLLLSTQRTTRGAVAKLLGCCAVCVVSLSVAAIHLPATEHVEGELQLFGGNTDSGRLGLYHGGQWGAVCSDAWGLPEATVACRMLGFERAFQAMGMPAPTSTPVWLSSVKCVGDESSLLECTAKRWWAGNCSAADAVGVSCLAAGLGDAETKAVDWLLTASRSQLRHSAALDEGLFETYRRLPLLSGAVSPCEVLDGVPLPFKVAASSHVYKQQVEPFFTELVCVCVCRTFTLPLTIFVHQN